MRRNPLEWAILIVSIAAILGVVGYLLVDAVAGPHDEPRIVAEVGMGAGAEGPTGWTAPVTIRNEGGTAVRALVLEATAMVDGAEEASVLTVNLLASMSDVELFVGFSAAPAGPVEVRIVGYEVP